jgi:MFS superfamily sulfate permease-like transporter
MFAVIAAIILAVAFVIRVTSTATDVILAPISLLLAGLVFLALHLAGFGTGWSYLPRRPRRRR